GVQPEHRIVRGFGPTSGPTDEGPPYQSSPDVECREVPGSEGQEDKIMKYCRRHINDQKLWWPGNDCHNAASRVLRNAGFVPPTSRRWNPYDSISITSPWFY